MVQQCSWYRPPQSTVSRSFYYSTKEAMRELQATIPLRGSLHLLINTRNRWPRSVLATTCKAVLWARLGSLGIRILANHTHRRIMVVRIGSDTIVNRTCHILTIQQQFSSAHISCPHSTLKPFRSSQMQQLPAPYLRTPPSFWCFIK